MYIGAWPELHLAKVVAALEGKQAAPGTKGVGTPGQRSASSEPLPRGDGAESLASCDTPHSAVSWPDVESLLRVPLCRRVDTLSEGDTSATGAQPFDIGPAQLPRAREQRRRSSHDSQQRLPPLPRQASSGSGPPKILRIGQATPSRARSQPRLFQPQLPHEPQGSSSSRSSSRQPPAGAAAGPSGLHPKGIASPPSMSPPQTAPHLAPPGPCHRPPVPVVGTPPRRSPPRQLPGLSSAPGSPQTAPGGDASRAAHSLPPPPRLCSTPPWRKASSRLAPAEGRPHAVHTAWASPRAAAEKPTGEAAVASREPSPSRVPNRRQRQLVEELGTGPNCEGTSFVVAGSDRPARDKQRDMEPSFSKELPKCEQNAVQINSRDQTLERESAAPAVSSTSAVAGQDALSSPRYTLTLQEHACGPADFNQSKYGDIEVDDLVEDEEADEALIAWSQGLRLSDFSEAPTSPGGAVAAALADCRF